MLFVFGSTLGYAKLLLLHLVPVLLEELSPHVLHLLDLLAVGVDLRLRTKVPVATEARLLTRRRQRRLLLVLPVS